MGRKANLRKSRKNGLDSSLDQPSLITGDPCDVFAFLIKKCLQENKRISFLWEDKETKDSYVSMFYELQQQGFKPPVYVDTYDNGMVISPIHLGPNPKKA